MGSQLPLRARAARAGTSGASILAPSRCSSPPIQSSRRRSRSGRRMATRSRSPRQPAQSPNARSLWLMDADGANPRQILEGNILTRWLADGSGLLYYNQTESDLLLRPYERPLSADSHSAGRGDHAHAESRWQSGSSINPRAKTPVTSTCTRVGLDGGQPRVVASTRRQDFHPFFSPSGRWVYFQPDHKNLYRVPGPGAGLETRRSSQDHGFPRVRALS